MITGRKIDLITFITTLSAMDLELKTGMKARRGYNPFSNVKKIFNLKGNRQKIRDQFSEIVEKAKQNEWPEGYKFINSEDRKAN